MNQIHASCNGLYYGEQPLLFDIIIRLKNGVLQMESHDDNNDNLNDIYDYAMANGALGGKLLGAGGGGFFLFYVKTFTKNSFLSAMKNKGLSQTIFHFDHDGMQSWTNRDMHK